MTSAMLPATASPRCAIALSRLVPPNDVMTSAPKLPKTANRASWRFPASTKVSANRPGMTMVARRARTAAWADQLIRQ